MQITQLIGALNDAHEVIREFRNGFRTLRRGLGAEEYLVPIMTSNSQGGYVASASSVFDNGHPIYCAFDRNKYTKWASRGRGRQWIQIQLPVAAVCNVAKIVSRADCNRNNQAPRDFEIQGSNNAQTWIPLTRQIGVQWTECGQVRDFKFQNETAYRYYRLVITANGGDGDAYGLGELIFIREIL